MKGASRSSHASCLPFVTRLNPILDEKGGLLVGEFDSLPFFPKRMFIQWGTSAGTKRGHHAHLSCWQILFPFTGSIKVDLEFCGGSESLLLDNDSTGLVLPPLVWATQTLLSDASKLLVLASESFDENDYIRDKAKFDKIIESHLF